MSDREDSIPGEMSERAGNSIQKVKKNEGIRPNQIANADHTPQMSILVEEENRNEEVKHDLHATAAKPSTAPDIKPITEEEENERNDKVSDNVEVFPIEPSINHQEEREPEEPDVQKQS